MTRRVLSTVLTAAVLSAAAAPALAYLTTDSGVSIEVTVARLAAPSLTVHVDGDDAVVTPVPAAEGPAPTSYDVLRIDPVDPDGTATTVCAAVVPQGICRDVGAAASAEGPLTYAVVAHLGTSWTATSRPSAIAVPLAWPDQDATAGPTPEDFAVPTGPTVSTGPASPTPSDAVPTTTSVPAAASPTATTSAPTAPSTAVTSSPGAS